MPSKAVSTLKVPLASASTFVAEQVVCATAAGGLAVPAADTAGLIPLGTAGTIVDTAPGADGTVAAGPYVHVVPFSEIHGTRYQIFNMANPGIASIGDTLYYTGASTVAASSSNSIKAGLLMEILVSGASGKVLVDTLR